MAAPAQYSGNVLKLGDDINTDVIYPGKYIMIYEPEEMKKYLFEGLGGGYAGRVRPGDIIVAGENFGCGSSREQAACAIKAAGVPVVIAKSFARIFFRNAINYGLLALTCPGAAEAAEDGGRISIDAKAGQIALAGGGSFSFPPLPEFLMEIAGAGGLVAHGKKIIAARKAAQGGEKR